MGPAESHYVHPSSSRSEQIAQFLVIVVLLQDAGGAGKFQTAVREIDGQAAEPQKAAAE